MDFHQEVYPQQEASWDGYRFPMYQSQQHQHNTHLTQHAHHYIRQNDHQQYYRQESHYTSPHGTNITSYQNYQNFYQTSPETDWNMRGRSSNFQVSQAMSTSSSAGNYSNQSAEIRDKKSPNGSGRPFGNCKEMYGAATPNLRVDSPVFSIQSVQSNSSEETSQMVKTVKRGRGGNSTRKRPATGDIDEDERIDLKRIANAKHQRVNRAQLKATNEIEREKNELIEKLFDQIEEIETRRVEDLQRASSDYRRRGAELKEQAKEIQEEIEEELERQTNSYLLEIRNAVRETKKAYRAKDRNLEKRKETIKIEENQKMHMKIAEEREAKMRQIQVEQLSRMTMDSVC